MAEMISFLAKLGISNSTSLTNRSQNCLVTSLVSYVNFERVEEIAPSFLLLKTEKYQ